MKSNLLNFTSWREIQGVSVPITVPLDETDAPNISKTPGFFGVHGGSEIARRNRYERSALWFSTSERQLTNDPVNPAE